MTATTDTRELISLNRVSLDDLLNQAEDIQKECRDFNVSNATYKNVRYDGDTCRLLYQPDDLNVASRSMGMTRHSLSQLCNKIGVPIRYIDKCIDSGRLELAAENINSWIDDFGKNLFIREYKDTVRGILSDKFSTLDTPHIIETLKGVLNPDEYSVKGHVLSPERFHARVIQREMIKIDGEDLFAGVQIDSSDVGRSVLVVKFMLYKQVCTNGLCIANFGGVLFSQKHIGIDSSEFKQGLVQSLDNIPTLIEYSKELVDKARLTTEGYNIRSLDKKLMDYLINYIKLKSKLSDDGIDKVFNLMSDKYGETKWGLVNALTEVAQDYTLERRIEIEKSAGDILMAA